MGLDIRVYHCLRKIDEPFDGQSNRVRVLNDKFFAGREAPLEDGAVYEGELVMQFRAGPYSTYNDWREQLAKLAGYPAITDDSKPKPRLRDTPHSRGCWESTSGPFWELINFTDCDGVIGAKACKKLTADFLNQMAQAASDPELWRLYDLFAQAVQRGSFNGAVEFT